MEVDEPYSARHLTFPVGVFLRQMEVIFHSIEDMLKGLTTKQQLDAISIEQVSSELHAINQRLQNIESQIAGVEQTESFNKFRFGQLADVSRGKKFNYTSLTTSNTGLLFNYTYGWILYNSGPISHFGLQFVPNFG